MHSVLIIFLLLFHSNQAVHNASVRICIDLESYHWLKVPKGLSISDYDIIEGIDEKDGKLSIARIDLNDDGKPEYIIRTLSGNGGCVCLIFNGKTLKNIGFVFGSPIWILNDKSKGFLTIETFSHQSVEKGDFTKYVFNGRRYQEVSSRELNRNQIMMLFNKRDKVKILK